MSRRVALAIAFPAVAVIGWFDYVAGPHVSLSLLYLIPIFAVAWSGKQRDAIVCAFTAALFAFLGDTPWDPASGVGAMAWDSFTRLVIFLAEAVLVARVRLDRQILAALNEELAFAYDRESKLARTDALTGLPNFRAFVEVIERESARAVREGSHLCVLYVDLDNFKTVNDGYGHATGDTVLQRVGAALRSSVRSGDVVARIGGDEFIILLWHAAREDADEIAARIRRCMDDIALEYPRAQLGASIGVRFFERTPANPEDVVRLSDSAMYDEKSRHKTTYIQRLSRRV